MMRQTVEAAIQEYSDKGYPVIAESLSRLRNYIIAKGCAGVSLDNIGYIGSYGITLHIDYYHVLFVASIATLDMTDIAHDYCYRTNSISLKAMWTFGRPHIQISLLTSVLNKIKSLHPNCCVYDNVITINEANDKAVDIFINLCNIVYEMRIISNKEIKEHIKKSHLKNCIEYPPIDNNAPF